MTSLKASLKNCVFLKEKCLLFSSLRPKFTELQEPNEFHFNFKQIQCTVGDDVQIQCTVGDNVQIQCTVGDDVQIQCTVGDDVQIQFTVGDDVQIQTGELPADFISRQPLPQPPTPAQKSDALFTPYPRNWLQKLYAL